MSETTDRPALRRTTDGPVAALNVLREAAGLGRRGAKDGEEVGGDGQGKRGEAR